MPLIPLSGVIAVTAASCRMPGLATKQVGELAVHRHIGLRRDRSARPFNVIDDLFATLALPTELTATPAPALAKAIATARPMPELAPVMCLLSGKKRNHLALLTLASLEAREDLRPLPTASAARCRPGAATARITPQGLLLAPRPPRRQGLPRARPDGIAGNAIGKHAATAAAAIVGSRAELREAIPSTRHPLHPLHR